MTKIEITAEYLHNIMDTDLATFQTFTSSDLAKVIRSKEFDLVKLMDALYQATPNATRVREIVVYAIKNSNENFSDIYNSFKGNNNGLNRFRNLCSYFDLCAPSMVNQKTMHKFLGSVYTIFPDGYDPIPYLVERKQIGDRKGFRRIQAHLEENYYLLEMYISSCIYSGDAKEVGAAIVARSLAFNGFDMDDYDGSWAHSDMGVTKMLDCVKRFMNVAEFLKLEDTASKLIEETKMHSIWLKFGHELNEASKRKGYTAMRWRFACAMSDAKSIKEKEQEISFYLQDEESLQYFSEMLFAARLDNGATMGNIDVYFGRMLYSDLVSDEIKAKIRLVLDKSTGIFFRRMINETYPMEYKRDIGIAMNMRFLIAETPSDYDLNENLLISVLGAFSTDAIISFLASAADFASLFSSLRLSRTMTQKLADAGIIPTDLSEKALLDTRTSCSRYRLRTMFDVLDAEKVYDFLVESRSGRLINPISLDTKYINAAPEAFSRLLFSNFVYASNANVGTAIENLFGYADFTVLKDIGFKGCFDGAINSDEADNIEVLYAKVTKIIPALDSNPNLNIDEKKVLVGRFVDLLLEVLALPVNHRTIARPDELSFKGFDIKKYL